MRLTVDARAARGGWFVAAVAVLLVLMGTTPLPTAAKARPKPSPSPSPAPIFVPPQVGPTSANLQESFSSELNTKERYQAAAAIADREGYPYVAQLFRACSRAEQAHADLHVRAIAWTGGEAKALLQRLSLGTTAENLRVAADLESYEAKQVYPAFLAKAREDGQSAAVRSITLALAAERQHAQFMKEALETLDQRRPPETFYVCERCGNTVKGLSFKKCPHCFASRNEFVAVK